MTKLLVFLMQIPTPNEKLTIFDIKILIFSKIEVIQLFGLVEIYLYQEFNN